jgi:hypothetical protein
MRILGHAGIYRRILGRKGMRASGNKSNPLKPSNAVVFKGVKTPGSSPRAGSSNGLGTGFPGGNWPSKTGEKSGGNRGNAPAKKS